MWDARRKSLCVAGLQGKKPYKAISHKKPILFFAVFHLWDSKHVPSSNEVSDTHHPQFAGRKTTLLVGKRQSRGSETCSRARRAARDSQPFSSLLSRAEVEKCF